MMRGQQVKGLANTAQHPERQNINFQQPQRVKIILVPFDDGALLHGGIANWHNFSQSAAR